MKFKNIYTIILLIITSLVLAWAIPALVKVGTTTPQNYPFVYYSSLLQDFAIKEKVENKPAFRDTKGNQYTKNQYDSITPLLSFRQLMLTNSMPDSILGVEVDVKTLKEKSIVWKYTPRDINSPVLDLYSMFESMSGRATLESPEDVFRLKNKIEFISMETNTVEKEKSDLFQKALTDNKFVFPANKVWGNLSPKKPYDEGYFVLDNNNQLFHIKMVNGKPYVRDTKAGKNINIAYFNTLEVPDKSIYGFVVTTEGGLYTLNTEGYGLTKFDIPNININSHSVMLMGNLFYWMVYVTSPEGSTYNVLKAGTLKKHTDPFIVNAQVDGWNKAAQWLFPAYVSLSDKDTSYIQPGFVFNFGKAFIISLILAVAFALTIDRKTKLPKRIAHIIMIILFGIPGFIASLIIR